MKPLSIVLSICLLFLVCCVSPQRGPSFKIEIVQADFSLALSRTTIVTDSLVRIELRGGLVGETPRIAWEGRPSRLVQDSIYAMLDAKIFDALRAHYTDSLTQDGLQLSFDITYRGRNRSVHVSNFPVPSLERLVHIVNTAIPDSLAIDPPSQQRHHSIE